MLCFWAKARLQKDLVGRTGPSGHTRRACPPYTWQGLMFPANASAHELEAAPRGNSSWWSWLRAWGRIQGCGGGWRVGWHWGSGQVSLVVPGNPRLCGRLRGHGLSCSSSACILRSVYFKISGNSWHLSDSHFPHLRNGSLHSCLSQVWGGRPFAGMAVAAPW